MESLQPRQPPEPEGHDLDQALRDVVRVLVIDYPWARPDHVAAMLRTNFVRMSDTEAPNRRLVRAERDTRAQIRRGGRPLGPAPAIST